MEEETPKAIIVGGSLAGISCARALALVGWEVTIIEKSPAPPTRSPTGAGLGLDHPSLQIISSWLLQPHLLQQTTLPLTIEQQVSVDEEKNSRVLTRDDTFNYRTAYWADLHALIYNALPSSIFLWGYLFLSFCVSKDENYVTVKAKSLQTGQVLELVGHLLVAADGSQSSIRQQLLPDFKLRYAGYYAWRGVMDFSECENSETIRGIRRACPELGKCLFFQLASGAHSALQELPRKRLNWIWYVNQPEPQLKGNSVTVKVNSESEMIKQMQQEAEKLWLPEFVAVIKATKEPFMNVIYDADPVEKIFWDNVVLVGDAAHPTTPHSLRSTNMSISDASVLAKCLQKWGFRNIHSALEEYQSIRCPVTSKQVLYSRLVGRIKQGLTLSDRSSFNPKTSSVLQYPELEHKCMPFRSTSVLVNNEREDEENSKEESWASSCL